MSSCCVGFFFQAEDGIRDLVRSRGLGDVYKRQGHMLDACVVDQDVDPAELFAGVPHHCVDLGRFAPVSYTHLTLPTSDLV